MSQYIFEWNNFLYSNRIKCTSGKRSVGEEYMSNWPIWVFPLIEIKFWVITQEILKGQVKSLATIYSVSCNALWRNDEGQSYSWKVISVSVTIETSTNIYLN